LAPGVHVESLVAMAGHSITEGYVRPPLPSVLSAETVSLSPVDLTVWCSLPLVSLEFLPPFVRAAIAVLSFSGRFTLSGAGIHLPAKQFPTHRGSMEDFALSVSHGYAFDLIGVTANLLGKSSLLNMPLAPFQLSGTAVSVLTDGIGQAIGHGSAALNNLTFDEQYTARTKRRQKSKQIDGVGVGVFEAGRSLARGVGGLTDIVRKPVEGAQEGGVRGFAKGMGRGIAGSVVKPIAAVGEAASDIGAGISSQAAVETKAEKRRRSRCRQRQPRLLFAESGEIRMWSNLEAELPRQLGWRFVRGVSEVIPLVSGNLYALVLLLFPQKLVVAAISMAAVKVASAGMSPSSAAQSEVPRSTPGGLADFFQHEVTWPFGPRRDEGGHATDVKGNGGDVATVDSLGCLRGVSISKLRAVRLVEAPVRSVDGAEVRHQLLLEHASGDNAAVSLSIGPTGAGIGVAVCDALVQGLRAAILAAPAGAEASWGPVSAALRAEREVLEAGKDDVGGRVLEVFEVQRWCPGTAEWRTPWLPIDRELSWRWVDTKGHRHPWLEKGLPKVDCAARGQPPCEFGGLFRPSSEWWVDVHGGTDQDGWSYGLAWQSATWDKQPGVFDGLRRRRWTREHS